MSGLPADRSRGMIRGILFTALLAIGSGPAGSARFVDAEVAAVVLGDQGSADAFLGSVDASFADAGGGMMVVRCMNADRREILELYAWPGSEEHALAEYRVRLARGADRGLRTVALARFQSGKGVHLGLHLEAVERILGHARRRTVRGRTTTLVYECATADSCPELRRVNMPRYVGRYVFESDVLASFEAGYPYP